MSDREMVEGYLYSWVANQLSAAVRLLPLGPSRAQVLQQRALPLIADQAEQLLKAHPQTLWSAGVGVSQAQLAHAELYSRLFPKLMSSKQNWPARSAQKDGIGEALCRRAQLQLAVVTNDIYTQEDADS